MTTFRSNNSKNINPISKYFTDLKNSDKFELIKHSQSSLRSLILLLIIVCKNCSGRIFLSHWRCYWCCSLGGSSCCSPLVLPAVASYSHRSSKLLLLLPPHRTTQELVYRPSQAYTRTFIDS